MADCTCCRIWKPCKNCGGMTPFMRDWENSELEAKDKEIAEKDHRIKVLELALRIQIKMIECREFECKLDCEDCYTGAFNSAIIQAEQEIKEQK